MYPRPHVSHCSDLHVSTPNDFTSAPSLAAVRLELLEKELHTTQQSGSVEMSSVSFLLLGFDIEEQQ